jgi:hypothetical protein
MGKMKELYMEIRNEYGDELPEDFSLAQHQLQKELEYEELREIEERLKQNQTSSNRDAENTSGSSETEEV